MSNPVPRDIADALIDQGARLIAENRRLRAALTEIASHNNIGITGVGRIQADAMVKIAREALATEPAR